MAKRRRFSISRSRLRGGLSKVKAAWQRTERYKAETERVVGQVVQTVEVQAGAFGFGWLSGRYGQIDVVGIPVDVGAAALLHFIGFTRLAGKHSEHAHNIGDGALAVYIASKGQEIGERMADEAGDRAAGVLIGSSRKAALGAARRNPAAASSARERLYQTAAR